MPQNLLRKSLEGYFLDVVDDRANNIPGRASYDKYPLAPATELNERRRRAACLDAILVQERERVKQNKPRFQQRWAEAQERMKEVEKNIINLSEHYLESDVERERYMVIVKRQHELKLLKLRDVQKLEDEKEFLKAVKKETMERLECFKPVKSYLEKVQEASQGKFKSIRELFDAYDELSVERGEMTKRDQASSALVAGRQRQFELLSAVKVNEAVLLNNHVFELVDALRALQDKHRIMDEDLAHIKVTAAQRAMILGQIRIACYNLYLQMCKKRNKAAKIKQSDSIQQLMYIKTSMIEMNKLQKMVSSILRHAKAEADREKLERLIAARDAHRKKLLAAHRHKAEFNDMEALFRIEKPKKWFELDEHEAAIQNSKKFKLQQTKSKQGGWHLPTKPAAKVPSQLSNLK